jgi:hypothetical protein
MATKNPIKLKDNFVEALDEFSDEADGLSKVQGLHADKVVAGHINRASKPFAINCG